MSSRQWVARAAVLLVVVMLVQVWPGGVELPIRPAYAASFTVDSTADAVDADVSDGLCRTLSDTCTLRAAIMQANALSGTLITLPAGTYTLTLAGVDEDLGLTGDLDVNAQMTIQGAGAATTFVDGNNAIRPFHVLSAGNLTLFGLTVQHGLSESFGDGGGILNQGNLTLDSVVVTANQATSSGGGLFQWFKLNGTSSLTTTNTTFSGNTAGFGSGLEISDGSASITGGAIESNIGHSGLYIGTGAQNVTITNTTISGHTDSADGFGGGIQQLSGNLDLIGATISNNSSGSGGGIWQSGGSLTITGTAFVNNHANKGGGLFSDISPTISDSSFIGNTATDKGGGYATSQFGGSPGANFTRVTFANNTAVNSGGAVFSNGAISVTGGTVTGNSALDGGGLALVGGGGGSLPNVSLTGMTIQNNTASRNGGGLALSGNMSGTFADLTIAGNHAEDNGGGMLFNAAGAQGLGQVSVRRTTINANTANKGAGIWSDAPVVERYITNSTISGNTAANAGGGVGITASGILFTNVTINANSVPSFNGSNIYRSGSGTLTFRNTIVANGSSGNCAVFGSGPSLVTAGGNLESGLDCQFTGPTDQRSTDPLLGPLASNGGTTQTHDLLANSPAIDRALNDPCPSEDQRTQPRPRDGNNDGQYICDVGAVEAPGAFPPPSPTATLTPTPTATPVPAVNRVPTKVTVTEGGASQSFALGLSSIPNSAVTVTFAYDQAQLTVSPASVTFQPNATALNAQQVTVAAKDDAVLQGNRTLPIHLTASSADPAYNGVAIDDEQITVVDNEAPAACTPRPRVQVQSTAQSGALKVTVIASSQAGLNNTLRALTWTSLANATVTVDGVGPVSQGQVTNLPAGVQGLTFQVRRVTAGQPTTVRFTVSDACGDWPTFVGGGPGAF